MTEDQIKSKIIVIIRDVAAVTSATPKEELVNDLGMDSLDVIEMVMELEEAFDIRIGDSQMDKFQTVGDVIKFVSENVETV